jgi:hypothetical protein
MTDSDANPNDVDLSEKFEVEDSDQGPRRVLFAGTSDVAGRLVPDGDRFHLLDSQDKDLGTFDSVQRALRVLYGSD